MASVVMASPHALGSSRPSATRHTPTSTAVRAPAACHAISAISASMTSGGTACGPVSMATMRSLSTVLIG